MNQTNEIKRVLFPGVKDGDTFTVAGMEFIKFPATAAGTPVVAKNIVFRSEFGHNNHLAESCVLEKMKAEVLPKIVEALGEENVLLFKTDLTTLDGLTPYEALESKISLPTLDFSRANVDIFDRHKVCGWWWLATPESARPHDAPEWTLCVAPSGSVDGYYCDDDNGVRPFLLFESSIFGSSEE